MTDLRIATEIAERLLHPGHERVADLAQRITRRTEVLVRWADEPDAVIATLVDEAVEYLHALAGNGREQSAAAKAAAVN